MRSIYFLLLSLLGLLAVTAAAQESWHINPNHSQVRFEVSFMSVSKVEGRFDEFRGSLVGVELSEEAVSFEKGEVILLVSGLTTGVSQRDKHLKGPDFFYSSLHPRFKVTLGAAQFKRGEAKTISANLTIKEVTRAVPLTLTYLGVKANRDSQRSAFFEVDAKLSRKEFSLSWNQYLSENELLLGDEITLSASVELNPTGERPALGQFFKLSKEERARFMKEAEAQGGFEETSDKNTLLLKAKLETLTQEVEALSNSNDVLRQQLLQARELIQGTGQKTMPEAITYAGVAVFLITMLFGLGAGIWFKWTLLKPLAMEDPKYVKLDRLSDMLLMVMILCGVGVMGWFFGLY